MKEKPVYLWVGTPYRQSWLAALFLHLAMRVDGIVWVRTKWEDDLGHFEKKRKS